MSCMGSSQDRLRWLRGTGCLLKMIISQYLLLKKARHYHSAMDARGTHDSCSRCVLRKADL